MRMFLVTKSAQRFGNKTALKSKWFENETNVTNCGGAKRKSKVRKKISNYFVCVIQNCGCKISL